MTRKQLDELTGEIIDDPELLTLYQLPKLNRRALRTIPVDKFGKFTPAQITKIRRGTFEFVTLEQLDQLNTDKIRAINPDEMENIRFSWMSAGTKEKYRSALTSEQKDNLLELDKEALGIS